MIGGAAKRRRQPERAEQQRVKQYLAALGAKIYTLGTVRRREDKHHGTMQTPGLPDLLAFIPDRWRRTRGDADATLLVTIEVKVKGGRLSDEQKVFREHCAVAHIGHVVGGLDDVIAWLLQARVIEPQHVPHYRQPARPAHEGSPHAE